MLNDFFEIEARYKVKDVKIAGLSLWPYLRIYFGYKFVYQNMIIGATAGAKNIFSVLSTSLRGVRHLFRKYDYIFFSVGEQRRKINDLYYDRYDYVTEVLQGKSLFFEMLFPVNHSSSAIPTKFRASRSVLHIIEYFLIKLLFYKKINGTKVLDQINHTYGLNINYKFFARKFYAQYLIGKALTKIYSPKAVFFITPYTNQGYLVAFRENGIPVVEMQHGVINKQHLGYNASIDFGEFYRPTYLITYGFHEIAVFSAHNYYINPTNIHPAGHFYFDHLIKNFFPDSSIITASKKYKLLVAVSAEYDVEPEIVPFINRISKKMQDILFLYMPRNKKATDYEIYKLESNILITDWLNAYQVIIHCDFHTCVRSTTALEAIALGTQNILINLRNYATLYYENLLSDEKTTRFVNDESEYIHALTTFIRLSREEVRQSADNLFIPNFAQNLRKILNKTICS